MGSRLGRLFKYKPSSTEMAAANPANEDYAEFMPREDWKANPMKPQGLLPMKGPVDSVVATWTETDACSTKEECIERLREIQREHIHGLGLPDIRHHFLVGGDGNVYEGRGWVWQGPTYPPSVEDADILSGHSIEVAFIDKSSTEPSQKLLEVLSSVITFGQEKFFLRDRFKFYWGTGDKIEFFQTYDPLTQMQPMLPAKEASGT